LPKRRSRNGTLFLAALFALVLAAGCASQPQVERKPLDRSSASAIRKVAIVQYPEPDQYVVVGASDVPVRALLYAFGLITGAVGGKVLDRIESARFNSQARSLTAAVTPHDPAASRVLADELERLLLARGLAVKRIEGAAISSPDKPLDYSMFAGDADAVIEASVTMAGYGKSGDAFTPMVAVRARMIGVGGSPLHYSELVVSGAVPAEKVVRVAQSSRYSVRRLETLFNSGRLASEGIQDSVRAIAHRIAADLAP
jgi:hypothetical protein